MISVPVAVNTPLFQWQLDLFWFNHLDVYGNEAYQKALAIIIKRNHSSSPTINQFPWHQDIPNQLCESFFDYNLGIKEDGILLPLNIQVGLIQTISKFKDDDVIELLDCDMFHLKKHPNLSVGKNELIVSDIYEKWHLKSLSGNKRIIGNYTGNKTNYYNGGFVPIIGRAETFKKILLDWIWFHKDIATKEVDTNIRWWAGMYALQAACEYNSVKMNSMNILYVPGINELERSHYIVHYSVDTLFDKKRFPNIDVSKFKDNVYYDKIRSWLAC